MQVAYTTRAFSSRYYANQSLKSAFDVAPADPTVDLNMQLPAGEVVRPRVPLEVCLASYSAPEEVMDFYSTALKSKTTAIKYRLVDDRLLEATPGQEDYNRLRLLSYRGADVFVLAFSLRGSSVRDAGGAEDRVLDQ